MSRVSVCLSSYNHEKYLREAIDSVLSQTFQDFELFILDDASTDRSWSIIQSYSDPRIHSSRGPVNRNDYGEMRRVVFEVSTGEYIALHHSDDLWEPQKLERQVAFLDANPRCGAVFSNALVIGEEGRPIDDTSLFYYRIFEQPNRSRHEWLRHFFFHCNALCNPSVLIRRSCYEECGFYREGLNQLDDFDMWVRLCLKHEIHVIPEKLVRFRLRDSETNTSGNRIETHVRWNFEMLQIYEHYLAIQDAETFLKVFPESTAYFTQHDHDVHFALAMTALTAGTPAALLFGLQLLFDMINDQERARRIEMIYGFRPLDFIELTAKHDPFSVKSLSHLSRQASERESTIQALSLRVAEIESRQAERESEARSVTLQLAETERSCQELRAENLLLRKFRDRCWCHRIRELPSLPSRWWRGRNRGEVKAGS